MVIAMAGRNMSNPGFQTLCTRIGATMHDVARMSGVDRRLIYHWLRGRNSPEVERKIAYVFSLTIPQLRARVFPARGKS
jgi:transcriptional regulator with XRE-family HTH domain